jgi:hypothetical protein
MSPEYQVGNALNSTDSSSFSVGDLHAPAAGQKVFDDFLSEHVGLGKAAGFIAAFLASRSIGSRLIAGETCIMSLESQKQPVPHSLRNRSTLC